MPMTQTKKISRRAMSTGARSSRRLTSPPPSWARTITTPPFRMARERPPRGRSALTSRMCARHGTGFHTLVSSGASLGPEGRDDAAWRGRRAVRRGGESLPPELHAPLSARQQRGRDRAPVAQAASRRSPRDTTSTSSSSATCLISRRRMGKAREAREGRGALRTPRACPRGAPRSFPRGSRLPPRATRRPATTRAGRARSRRRSRTRTAARERARDGPWLRARTRTRSERGRQVARRGPASHGRS